MTHEEIVAHICTLIDEVMPTSTLPVPIDGFADYAPIEDKIEALLPDCVREVLLQSPLTEVPIKRVSLQTSGMTPDGGCLLAKPVDYLRLQEVRLEGWRHAVRIAPGVESRAAMHQGNPHLRAGVCRPVAIDAGSEWRLYPSSSTTVLLSYVADQPAASLPSHLQQAVCEVCAKKMRVSGEL